jgi:hypothetical protein
MELKCMVPCGSRVRRTFSILMRHCALYGGFLYYRDLALKYSAGNEINDRTLLGATPSVLRASTPLMRKPRVSAPGSEHLLSVHQAPTSLR